MRPILLISYAGLDAAALWDGARCAFARSRQPVPRRLRDILPLFPSELTIPMRYVGQGAPLAAPSGFSLDENEYHAALSTILPQLYQGENRLRCFDYEGRFRGGVVRVDAAWTRMFPQYAPFAGERLVVRLIGGGCEAVAVPQSIGVRCAELLDGAERDLGITARTTDFIAYVHARLARLETYEPDIFAKDYLKSNGIKSLLIRQEDLSRAMQQRAIARAITRERASRDELFTGLALSASAARQYQPFERACDCFAEETVTRHTARLVQLFHSGDEQIGDLWLVYEDARAYMNRSRRVLDARALCEGFQLPPIPNGDGASYPDSARVAVLHNRDARLLVARTLNNPAYGSGLSPQGTLNRLVWLEDSVGMLYRRELSLENVKVTCVNTEVSAQEWERMARQARTQERKGRLIDEMYRRECALEALAGDNLASGRALLATNERAEALEHRLSAFGDDAAGGEYDADLAYLRRKARARSGMMALDERPFEVDAQREHSIECGFAMRAAEVEGEGWQPDTEPLPVKSEPETSEVTLVSEEDEPDTWAEMLATFAEVRARMNDADDAEPFGEAMARDESPIESISEAGYEDASNETLSDEVASEDVEDAVSSSEATAPSDEAAAWNENAATPISEAEYEGESNEVLPVESASEDTSNEVLPDEAASEDVENTTPSSEAAAWSEAPATPISEAGYENASYEAHSVESASEDVENTTPSDEAAAWNENAATPISEAGYENASYEAHSVESASEDVENTTPSDEAATWKETAATPISEAVYEDASNEALPAESASEDVENTTPSDEAATWSETPTPPISEAANKDASDATRPPFSVSEDAENTTPSSETAIPSDESTITPSDESAAWSESPTPPISEPANEAASNATLPAAPASEDAENTAPSDESTITPSDEAATWNEAEPPTPPIGEPTTEDTSNAALPAAPASEDVEDTASSDESSTPPSSPARPPMVSTTPPPNHTGVPPQPRRSRGKKARHRKARERQMRYEQIGMFAKPAPAPLVELGDAPQTAPSPQTETPPEPPATYTPRSLSELADEQPANQPFSMKQLLDPKP